jgi:hypothetical protein
MERLGLAGQCVSHVVSSLSGADKGSAHKQQPSTRYCCKQFQITNFVDKRVYELGLQVCRLRTTHVGAWRGALFQMSGKL